MRASAAAERAGVPTVAIVSSTFLKAAEAVAKGLGMSGLKIAQYPGMPMADSAETARKKARENLLPDVIAGLTASDTQTQAPIEEEHELRDIVFRGALDEVNDHFHERLWTDGMAIIPPTVGRVETFLRYTEREPGDVLGLCP